MLINGEKYACEACVRGHRVSSCTHSDRKLLHVNKKGRPVSQCQHCRSLRKARSQHVRCDCQDKAHAKEDCPHLKEDNGGGSTIEDLPQVIQPKDSHKSRISSLNSHDSKATVFINGHHKPVHKFNDAHNHCGAPYRKPSRSNTVHGHRDFAQRSTDSLPLLRQAPRQTESPLHTVMNAPQQIRKVKSEHNSPELGPMNPHISAIQELYIPPLSPNAYSYSPFDSSSPAVGSTTSFDLGIPENIPDSWFMSYDEAHKNDTVPCTNYNKDGFGETPPIDWSQYGSCGNAPDQYPMVTNGYMSNQISAYGNPFEHINMTSFPRVNSSSGDVSETDDYNTVSRPSNLRTVSNASNDFNSPGDDLSESHRLSTASSYHGTPQANMLAGNLGNLDIDEFVAQAVAAQTVAGQRRINLQRQQHSHQTPPGPRTQTPPIPQAMRTPPISRQSHTPPISQSTHSPGVQQNSMMQPQQSGAAMQDNNNKMGGFPLTPNYFATEHPFTIHEAQTYAHMGGNETLSIQNHSRNSPMPATIMEDPMWSAPMGAFKLDDPREDEDWIR